MKGNASRTYIIIITCSVMSDTTWEECASVTLSKLSDSLLEFVTSFGSFMPGLLASVLCEVELATRTCSYIYTVTGYSYVYSTYVCRHIVVQGLSCCRAPYLISCPEYSTHARLY